MSQEVSNNWTEDDIYEASKSIVGEIQRVLGALALEKQFGSTEPASLYSTVGDSVEHRLVLVVGSHLQKLLTKKNAS